MRESICVARVNAKLNMSSRMTIENDKLNKVDVALAREMAKKQRQISLCNSNMQVVNKLVCILLDYLLISFIYSCLNWIMIQKH